MSATTSLRSPTATNPPPQPPKPVLGAVDVELMRGGGGLVAPAGVTRQELDRVESRLLDHLTRAPAARKELLTDPVAVLRAAAPDATPALVSAVVTSHRAVTGLPVGLAPDRLRVGLVGRLPLPARPPIWRPARPVAPPANGLAGFDACLAVGAGPLGRALSDLLGPFLSAVLAVLTPANGAFTLGLADVTVAPTAAIDVATGRARLAVTANVALTVLGTGASIPGLSVEIGIDVAIARTADGIVIEQAGVDVTLLGLQVPLLSQLLDAVIGLIATAVRGVFPRPFPLDLPGGSPATCDIGLRDVAVGFLPGQAGTTEPCLAILTSLLADAEGDIAALRSPLPAGKDAGVFLDNVFLLRSIACEVQRSPQLEGLPAPTHQALRTDATPFVSWTDLEFEQELGGETIEIRELTIAIDGTDPLAKEFVVSAELTVKRRLFEADVSLRVPVTLDLAGGAIVPRIGTPTYDVKVRVTLLGAIVGIALAAVLGAVGALVGALIAGIVATITGGVIGAGVVAAAVALIVVAIKKKIGSAIEAAAGQPIPAVQVIPPPLVELFGILRIADLVFDDLELLGTLVPVARGVTLTSTVLDRKSVTVGTGPQGTTVHLSTTVRFTAQPHRMADPVTYRWRFGTTALGGLDRPAGIATVAIGHNTCTLTSVSGADIDGVLTVVVTDRFGAAVSGSTPMRLTGRLTVTPEDGGGRPKPDPLFPEQP